MNYRDISFVIPTNRNNMLTAASIPSESEVIIDKSEPLGRGRNKGIRKAKRDWIILCDDDISFTTTFLDLVCELLSEEVIVGLEGYYPSPFVIGRFMAFYYKTFEDIGKFDIRAHGDETEWQMRAVKKDYRIVRLSRDCVFHYPHKKSKPISEWRNLVYLIRKHPDFLLYVSGLLRIKMKKSSYDGEYI